MPNGTDQNTQSAADELAAVVTQLDAERKAKANLEATIAGRDARIAELEGSLSEAKKAAEMVASELATIKAGRDEAVGKYLSMAKTLNPGIPPDIISGNTISEIDTAVEKGKAIVEAVKAAITAETAATRVPAGAPPREATPGIEGMSPREKITYGTRPKGGIS